jgi:hypothetical protein
MHLGVHAIFGVPDNNQPTPVRHFQVTTQLGLTDTWQLTATSVITSDSWSPQITVSLRFTGVFGGLFDLFSGQVRSKIGTLTSGFLDPRIRDRLAGLLPQLDSGLTQFGQKLPATLEEAWHRIQDPFRMDESADFWCCLRPHSESLNISLPTQTGGNQLHLEFLASPEILLSRTAPHVELQRLGPPSSPSLETNNFSLAVPVRATFSEANDALRKELLGKTITSSDNSRRVTVRDLSIGAVNQWCIAKVTVDGDFRATFYCTGRLAFDPATSRLSVVGFDYSLETRNILLKAYEWLQHTDLAERIGSQLVIDMAERVEQARLLVSAGLNRNLGDMRLTTSFQQPLALRYVTTDDQGFVALVEVSGDATLRFVPH